MVDMIVQMEFEESDGDNRGQDERVLAICINGFCFLNSRTSGQAIMWVRNVYDDLLT